MLGRMMETLSILLVANLLISEGGDAYFHRAALLHGTARISYSPSERLGTIKSVTWRLDKNGGRVIIVDNSEKPYYFYHSQFKDRLQMSDNLFTLTVMNLTMEDTGIYTMDIADVDGRAGHYSFNVTVYDPVPPPLIRTELKENTERCNVTLHCSVQSHTSDLSYTWKYRHQDSEYHLYNNGSVIQISVQPDHQDTEFLCIVHNPADQKNVSVRLQETCAERPHVTSRSLLPLIIKLALVVLFLVPSIYLAIIVHGRKGSKVSLENTKVESDEETTC